MGISILNSKLNSLKLDCKLDKIKGSKTYGKIFLKKVSKFTEIIKSEMDIPIPMEVDITCLSEGGNRDGMITENDLHECMQRWVGIPIIDFHDEDLTNPTKHKLSDRKGFLGDNVRVENIDGKNWIVNNAFITDRYLAYLIFLADKMDKPYEVSPEFMWNPIRPSLMTITDTGHLQGNKITIKSGDNMISSIELTV